MTTQFLIDNPPLMMVAAELRFSAVPTFDEAEHSAIHKALMAFGYPERISTPINHINIQVTPDGVSTPSHAVKKREAFRAVGARRIFYVMQDCVFIKFTDHHSFDETLDNFLGLLGAVEEAITELTMVSLQGIGLRYANLIVPLEGDLSNYLDAKVLPCTLPLIKARLRGGLMISQANTERGGSIRLMVERIPTGENHQVHKILPDDLLDPDARTTLQFELPEKRTQTDADSYAILDIDHQQTFANNPAYNKQFIRGAFQELHNDVCLTFRDALAQPAKQEWGFKEKTQ